MLAHRLERDEDWSPPGQLHHRLVAVEVGLDDDDLVARVHMAEDSTEEGLVGSVSDEDLLVGVQSSGSGQQFCVELRQSVDKPGMTLESCVRSYLINKYIEHKWTYKSPGVLVQVGRFLHDL